jgi:leader peptidase (prepilin peptidase) / N-methyltransferase
MDSAWLGMTALLAIVVGLCVGSFFNVVIYRLPRGESLSYPPSRCPGCGTEIKPYDNVPVLSWLFLRGRCRSCHTDINWRYPAVELLTAALAAGIALTSHGARELSLGFILVAVLVPISFIDWEFKRIPNLITGLGAAAAIVAGLITDPSTVSIQLLWGAIVGGFLLIFALAAPSGLGMGDVKLAAVMGLCLERSVVVAMLVGLLMATLFAVGLVAVKGSSVRRRTTIPLGPFLAAGGAVAIFVGPHLMHWYLHSIR